MTKWRRVRNAGSGVTAADQAVFVARFFFARACQPCLYPQQIVFRHAEQSAGGIINAFRVRIAEYMRCR
jgi:hypothetical protein